MRNGVTNKVLAVLTVFLLASMPAVAGEVYEYGYPVDAATSSPNDTVASGLYITADTQHRPGYTLADIYISWEIKPGDTVEVHFWDGQAQELPKFSIAPSNTSVRNYVVTPPDEATTGQIVLKSGSASGFRCAWIKKFYNNRGDMAIFLDPELEDDPGDPGDPDDPGDPGDPDDPGDPGDPDDPGGSGCGCCEGVVAALNEIKGAINGMSSGVITELQGIGDQLADLTSDMNQQFDAVKSRLDVISNDVADIRDDVDVIRRDLASLKDYFMTPRSPAPLQMDPLPAPSMDSSVPDLSEPYQTPYTYDRDDPEIPPANFSPEPLPLAPDPTVMPHDEPLLADAPMTLNEPIPRENPRTMDPVVMEEPRQMDPVIIDPPLGVDTPITRQEPFGRDNPFTPQPPLTPTPPITPGG